MQTGHFALCLAAFLWLRGHRAEDRPILVGWNRRQQEIIPVPNHWQSVGGFSKKSMFATDIVWAPSALASFLRWAGESPKE
jgi:hypothetical protein